MKNIVDGLKEYFENTPREQVLKDWEEAGKKTEGVQGPTIQQYLDFVKKTNQKHLYEKPCPPRGKTCPMTYMYIPAGQSVICGECNRVCYGSTPVYL